MFKYLVLSLLFASSYANAGTEISYINCEYSYSEGVWSDLGITLMTIPFSLAPRETRVIESTAYYPIKDLESDGITRCSELVGSSTDRMILKTHYYRFLKFEKFNDNSCKPIGEGVEFIQMNADLIAVGKPFFAEMAYPWNKDAGNRTVFNLITGEQTRQINAASEEDRDKMLRTLCQYQKPW